MSEPNNGKTDENEYVYDLGFPPKEIKLSKDYKLYQKSMGYRIVNKFMVFLGTVFAFFPKTFVWGFRLRGKQNRKNIRSCVMVSNHVHPLDLLIIHSSMGLRHFYVTVLQSNLGLGLLTFLIRIGGGVPIPTDKKIFARFDRETKEMINKGNIILFYAEASLLPYCDHIRTLSPGAFHFAASTTGKIVPTVITFHKPKGFYKIVRKNKPCIQYHILEPYYIKDMGHRRETVEKARADVQKIMSDYFIRYSDYYYDENGKRNGNPMPHNRFIKHKSML